MASRSDIDRMISMYRETGDPNFALEIKKAIPELSEAEKGSWFNEVVATENGQDAMTPTPEVFVGGKSESGKGELEIPKTVMPEVAIAEPEIVEPKIEMPASESVTPEAVESPAETEVEQQVAKAVEEIPEVVNEELKIAQEPAAEMPVENVGGYRRAIVGDEEINSPDAANLEDQWATKEK
ncbi:MAG: hypothetical protein NTW79_04490 [Candidatus Berkelbacteria bacterium]|nr:hypothetical protein [Candidatus Berkelbacteria bacterium]